MGFFGFVPLLSDGLEEELLFGLLFWFIGILLSREFDMTDGSRLMSPRGRLY